MYIENAPYQATFMFSLLMFALVVVLVLLLRWFSHRERMAIIAQGKYQPQTGHDTGLATKNYLAKGIMITLIGLAITISLLTVGVGPWLLFGLLPFFVGVAMIIAHRVAIPNPEKSAVDEESITNEAL